MWPPPGTSSFPQGNPPSLRRSYTVAKPNAAGLLDVTGPFMAVRVPDSQGLSMVDRAGQVVNISDRIKMPLESQVRVRCIITDVVTNVSYEVLQARTFATFIECLVSRSQADV